MAVQARTTADRSRFLRLVLQADGLASLLSGVLLLAAAPAVAGWLGLPTWVALVAGALLLPNTALLWYTAARPVMPPALVWGAIIIDTLWVAGSVWLLFAGFSFTAAGWWVIVAQALMVDAVAVAKFIGQRQAVARQ